MVHLGSLAYLSSYIYHQPLKESQNLFARRWNLSIQGKIGIMTAQSLLLHTIIAQVLYDTVRLRKVSRFSCNSWWFGGYLKASWRSMLDFSGREPWMPPRSQNDEDVQLLHGKGIKRHLLISSTDCNSRDLYSVLMWELLGANRCENLVIFLRISVAIDLHEETTFIAHGIFTNSITQPFRFVLYYI